MRDQIRQIPGDERAQSNTLGPDWLDDNRRQFGVELQRITDFTGDSVQYPEEDISTLRPERRRIFESRMTFRKSEMSRSKPSFIFEGPETLPDA